MSDRLSYNEARAFVAKVGTALASCIPFAPLDIIQRTASVLKCKCHTGRYMDIGWIV